MKQLLLKLLLFLKEPDKLLLRSNYFIFVSSGVWNVAASPVYLNTSYNLVFMESHCFIPNLCKIFFEKTENSRDVANATAEINHQY